jgi:predicted metal-dependent hydrolase
MILLGEEVNVVVEKKRIKNIYFRINENNEIYVTCPKYVSNIEINKMLEKNRDSLEKMYKKQVKKNERSEKVLYLGRELDFVYYKKIMFEENYAFGPSVDKINEYLEKNSLKVFQERMDLYTPTFRYLPKFRLRIRNMKTRWGVCNKSSMTVTLNSKLIHYDFNCIDYVIVHELSHFEHMDHSSRFWKCVEEHYPNYKSARKELRD